MSNYGPDARRRFLDSAGIVRRDDDTYFRSHPNVPLPGHHPAPSEAELISRSWRASDPSRTIWQTEIDVAASGPETGTVRRTRMINLDCAWCGGESLLPAPGDTDAPFICGPCADDSYHARRGEQIDADLAMRTAIRDLDEILPCYDGPLGNPLRRPAYRVAYR